MMSEEEADNAFAIASEHSPKSSSWGFFSYLDVPPAFCGSGMGGFSWFATKEEMLDFLEEAYPCSTRKDDEDKEAVCALVKEKRMLTSDDHMAVMELLNEELGGHLQMEWVGTLKDLHTGNHRYALYLRARFRTDDLEDCSDDVRLESPLEILERHGQPLKAGERSDFMDYIAEWGI